jgi:DNA-binding Lrp family transcriptional regulator
VSAAGRPDDAIVAAVQGAGLTLETLAQELGISAAETVRRVAVLEADGAVVIESGVVRVSA